MNLSATQIYAVDILDMILWQVQTRMQESLLFLKEKFF